MITSIATDPGGTGAAVPAQVHVARRGVLIGVTAACTYAVGPVACAAVVIGIDLLGDRVQPLPLAVLLITGSLLAMLVAAPLTGVVVPADGDDWLLVLALGIVPGVIGSISLLAAIGDIGPSLASILLTLEPPVTLALAWLALGERLSALQLAGGVVILAAMIVANQAAARPPLEVPPA